MRQASGRRASTGCCGGRILWDSPATKEPATTQLAVDYAKQASILPASVGSERTRSLGATSESRESDFLLASYLPAVADERCIALHDHMYFAAIGDMPSRRCDDRSLPIKENCTLNQWGRRLPNHCKMPAHPRRSVKAGPLLTAMRRLFSETSDECLVYVASVAECRGRVPEQDCACLRPSLYAGLLVANAHETSAQDHGRQAGKSIEG
jgi:hypothetical protein